MYVVRFAPRAAEEENVRGEDGGRDVREDERMLVVVPVVVRVVARVGAKRVRRMGEAERVRERVGWKVGWEIVRLFWRRVSIENRVYMKRRIVLRYDCSRNGVRDGIEVKGRCPGAAQAQHFSVVRSR